MINPFSRMFVFVTCVALASTAAAQTPTAPSAADLARWTREAQNVTITRDDWGIPHISGETDADAVFGLLYAQAEDDFNRVETNYFDALGRAAEAEGEGAIYRDLRYRLINNPESLKKIYARAPRWLQSVMNAWADGLNYYLYKHPEVKPKVIARFEPWMPLAFSDGSIGPDIESVNLAGLEGFYGKREAGGGKREAAVSNAASAPTPVLGFASPLPLPASRTPPASLLPLPASPDKGSNGAAIAPSNTLAHHALLLINPHTSFFFRAEVQVTSQEGLNDYGAVTWGQFFVYQGFNERAGWMHSSTGADNIDEYLETVSRRGDHYVYRYGNAERSVTEDEVVIRYRTPQGMAAKNFTIYHTHHGPVVREQNGKWVAVRLMQKPLDALIQSFTRMKARDLKAFRQTMELHTNSSNNTTYADADGNIAYFHSNFIPRRDTSFDWTKPVDGSDPRTEWHGVLSIDESPNSINPPNGWVFNSNNWPWSAAGPNSPKRADFPRYVEKSTEESPRGRHALRVLPNKKDFTVASLISAAYDSWLPSFARMIPGLLQSYDRLPATATLKASLAPQIDTLRTWDYRWGTSSVPTSLAVFWGEDVFNRIAAKARAAGMSQETYEIERATDAERLQSLEGAAARLGKDFGRWQTPWGEINRFQRITDDIFPKFDDSAPSIPVPFTSSRWGSLASFAARPYPQTKKWYGTSGNSFVAVVEFRDSVRARAITAGGESGNPRSPHFNDEALRYSTGNLRDVYFYPSQLKAHTERVYHPGD
ncbi:MAG TPA: penicillin acylase family protein [Gemmatimonadaceae bacterium]|nr:penicillin acylase family protein [Gemmatimonadaceae bacterium]